MQLSQRKVLDLLRTGTSEARVEFLQDLPPNGFKDAAIGSIGSDNPGMVIVALGSLIQQYCNGCAPECGAILAAAAHERAVEIWETVPNHGLIATTLSGLANNHVKALTLLGHSDEVLEVTQHYIPFYERLEEHENLPSLKVLRIEALVNLQRIDEAAVALQDQSLLGDPIVGIEAHRLKGWVDQYRGDITKLGSEVKNAPDSPSAQNLVNIMRTAIGLGFQGEDSQKLKQQVDQLDLNKRFDPQDPTQFQQLLENLEKGENFLTKGATDSDIAIRGKIRSASAIFVHGTPTTDVIEHSLAELESCLVWAKEHAVTELQNDAYWGIYLCNSRLARPSEAADALIQLRTNLESMRSGIRDPFRRGGVFSAYKYLFNALCEKLYQAGRAEDLLEAIESSKGRIIADRLTDQSKDVVEDAAIYGSVKQLPDFTRRKQFHYLTYFVDEKNVYAVLVSKHGKIQAIEPISIDSSEIRRAAETVDPNCWGQPDVTNPGTRIHNVSDRLAPLVAWLDGLLVQGIVDKGDHICYSSDDDLHNVPLQYLRFKDSILIDWFSVSRVHSAFHLDLVLRRKASAPPGQYLGVVVPLRQDLEKSEGETFLCNLDVPSQRLENHGLSGRSIRLGEASLECVIQEDLSHRIVHFSTHGWFPEETRGNPYHDSYLLLADEQGLPDEKRVIGGQHNGKLTPSAILDKQLNLENSHISVMACISGLAKEGIAGDTLGLDWAFIQSGASSLISTHWKVSAACAAQFFTSFYQKWIIDGQSRALAHRETLRELLSDTNSPSSLQRWAAFSLTGDFR